MQPDTGHEIYVTGSACARQHADTYFTTGTLPPPNTTCTLNPHTLAARRGPP
ncbi:alpha/beta hydrolase [Nonomuraea endophytica]|uniref:alpha/beta hydrolase n=1 Tax=Nonomuraea endophytica TaxID=714136 RepID=UPI001611537F